MPHKQVVPGKYSRSNQELSKKCQAHSSHCPKSCRTGLQWREPGRPRAVESDEAQTTAQGHPRLSRKQLSGQCTGRCRTWQIPEHQGNNPETQGTQAAPPKGSEPATRDTHKVQMYRTETTSKRLTPPGAWNSAVSPSSFPISARAIGLPILIRPALISASSSPTIW